MSYDYAAYLRSLECLFGLDALGDIKFPKQFHIVKAQVPPSGEETGYPNDIVAIGIHLYGAIQKRDTSSRGMTNPQPHFKSSFNFFPVTVI
ncbi:hypothetical protein TNCV_3760661 [Trichonephila clavipes]|nr:hypothetical protein TNCV_3760661 [Trichonephila clavipes]